MFTLIKAWGPVILWSCLMFFFSTGIFSFSNTSRISTPLLLWIFPGSPSDWLDTIHYFMRKLGHWTEYFIFAVLLMRALRGGNQDAWDRRWIGWTLIIVVLYALSDEFHQIFVPHRASRWSDVILDVFGGSCGAFWMYLRAK